MASTRRQADLSRFLGYTNLVNVHRKKEEKRFQSSCPVDLWRIREATDDEYEYNKGRQLMSMQQREVI
jgi:hypothetical protein